MHMKRMINHKFLDRDKFDFISFFVDKREKIMYNIYVKVRKEVIKYGF